MPKFSEKSKNKLAYCHIHLQDIANTAIKFFDFSVICGIRSKDAQEKSFKSGFSKLKYPESMHNLKEERNENYSLAMDCVPYPVDWKDLKRFYFMGGLFLAIAEMKGYKIRWGGDWNRDYNFTDQKFNDLPHFEVVL